MTRRPSKIGAGIGLLLSGLIALSVAAGSALALPPGYTETKLTLTQPGFADGFGLDVAAADDGSIVVGSDGEAVVYRPDPLGGYVETILTPASGAGTDFGSAVAISTSGDTVAVVAPRDDEQGSFAGAVYAFRVDGTGGYTQTKLIPAEAGTFSGVGDSVAVIDDKILVGSVRLGGVFIFEPDGGGGYSETKLSPSSLPADFYGSSIAVAGELVVVGAYRALDGDGVATGAVYVYRPNGAGGYTETRLLPTDGEAGDEFGWSVDTDGASILVGATGDNGTTGATYLYEVDGTGGYSATRLTASDGSFGDRYGTAVAVDGDHLAVGTGFNTQAAYYYSSDGSGGFAEAAFAPEDGNPGGEFGRAVEVVGETLIVGAPAGGGRGVYVYRTDGGGTDGSAISGEISDLSSVGVGGAQVDLFTSGRQNWLSSTTTAADGTFRFEAAPGCYVVTHVAPAGTNFATGPYRNTSLCVTAGVTTGGIDATLLTGAGSAEIGTLVVDEDGSPVSGLIVDLFAGGEWLGAGGTGSDGGHSFGPLEAGCYSITFIAPTGQTFAETGSQWYSVPVCVETGQMVERRATLAGLAPADGTIVGTVTSADGPEQPSITIDLFTAMADGSRGDFITDTRIDETGNFTLTTAPGCYVITFIAPTGQTFTATNTRWQQSAVCVQAGESTIGVDAVLN